VSAAVDTYAAYLQTDHWRAVRRRCLVRYGYRCAICNSAQFVEVHHRDYSRIGAEADPDVIVLCRACHRLFHDHRRLAG
jgi:5-methylcytosine-specific restriction endonuclease McrA